MAGLLIFPRADVMLKDLSTAVKLPPMLPCSIGADSESVYVAIPTPQGQWVMASFDLALFLTAADTFKHTHGDPRECRTSRTHKSPKGN